jgi:hypothetical protein
MSVKPNDFAIEVATFLPEVATSAGVECRVSGEAKCERESGTKVFCDPQSHFGANWGGRANRKNVLGLIGLDWPLVSGWRNGMMENWNSGMIETFFKNGPGMVLFWCIG